MKSLSINDLVKQDAFEPIYVINNTNGQDRGEVFFTVQSANGTKEDHVRVPSTYIPVCLTDQVTREQLLGSAPFRRAVSNGMLTLVDPDQAQTELAKDENSDEVAQVQKLLRATTVEDVQAGLGESQTIEKSLPAPVVSLIELMDSHTDESALSTLRNLGKLEANEYKAIWSKAKKIGFVKTAEYAKAQGTNT